jgi:hypothetical protein
MVRRRVGRGMRAITYAALAVIVLSLGASSIFPWLQGRTNSDFPGLLLSLAALAAWLGFTAALLWEVLRGFAERQASSVVLRLVLLAVACLPWAILMVAPSADEAFARGFGSWAAARIDDAAIREWHAALSELPSPTTAPGWWPTTDSDVAIGAPPAHESLVPAIADPRASEVRVLRETGAVLMAWDGRAAGWLRFVLVGIPGCQPPAEFSDERVQWREVKPGVLIGITEQP